MEWQWVFLLESIPAFILEAVELIYLTDEIGEHQKLYLEKSSGSKFKSL